MCGELAAMLPTVATVRVGPRGAVRAAGLPDAASPSAEGPPAGAHCHPVWITHMFSSSAGRCCKPSTVRCWRLLATRSFRGEVRQYRCEALSGLAHRDRDALLVLGEEGSEPLVEVGLPLRPFP